MTSPLVLACTSLLDVMSHDERETVAAHLAGYGPVALPMGGEPLRFVAGLFEPGAVLTASGIVVAAKQHDPTVTRKQIYNALGYLTRRRAIRRLKYGRYEAPTDPTPQKDRADG